MSAPRAERLRGVGLTLGLCLAIGAAGCRADRDAPPRARSSSTGLLAPVSREAAQLRGAFEEQAAAARNDLDDARRSAERFLGSRVAPTRRQAEVARRKAQKAIALGERVLGEAAADGGRSAEEWARVIQDRMMRLEETLNRLTGATGHADS